MPNILIVAATRAEIEPLLQFFKAESGNKPELLRSANHGIFFLITGVGMVNTAFYMGKYSHFNIDLIINAGICGAVNSDIKAGEVLNVTEDILSEMGAENDQEFLKYAELDLGGTNLFRNHRPIEHVLLNQVKKVKGITVNTVHGNSNSIRKMIGLFDPDIESMEGAAFLRACQEVNGRYLQLRAVSNVVEKRDKSKWQIPLAIKNLNELLIKLVQDLASVTQS